MGKPRLTSKVMRGLVILATDSVMVDYLHGSVDEEEAYLERKDINDAKAAERWIWRMKAWREDKKGKQQ